MNQIGEATTVQANQPRPRKLVLARETLRTLGDATLAGAAGGTLGDETGFGPCDPWSDPTSGSAI